MTIPVGGAFLRSQTTHKGGRTMQTFRMLEDVESADLTPAVKNVVISCVQNLMDAYG